MGLVVALAGVAVWQHLQIQTLADELETTAGATNDNARSITSNRSSIASNSSTLDTHAQAITDHKELIEQLGSLDDTQITTLMNVAAKARTDIQTLAKGIGANSDAIQVLDRNQENFIPLGTCNMPKWSTMSTGSYSYKKFLTC